MSHTIKIEVRPYQTVRFPGICVHCGQPAAQTMTLRKRIGRVTRQVDVPLCTNCQREMNRQSGEEERLDKLGWLTAGGTAVLALAVVLLLTPAGMTLSLRLLTGVLLAVVLAEFIRQLFRRAQRQAMLPVKKAILQSANLTNFSWRAATFEFTNETFAERFEEMNQLLLMGT
jgi:hypothetical protein